MSAPHGTEADRETARLTVREFARVSAGACFEDLYDPPCKTRRDVEGRMAVLIASAAWSVVERLMQTLRAEGRAQGWRERGEADARACHGVGMPEGWRCGACDAPDAGLEHSPRCGVRLAKVIRALPAAQPEEGRTR